jgi:hypothetical protein
VAARARPRGLSVYYELRGARSGLDLQAKTVGAVGRNEEGPSAWNERAGPRPRASTRRRRVRRAHRARLVACPSIEGAHAFGCALRSRGKNTTLIASMTLEGMGPYAEVEGSTTKAVFEAYVR